MLKTALYTYINGDILHVFVGWFVNRTELSMESMLLHRPVLLSTTWPSNAKYLHTTIKS